MKATIYNITVEGTPEEIVQFKQLLDNQFIKNNITIDPYVYPCTTNPFKWTDITCNISCNHTQ